MNVSAQVRYLDYTSRPVYSKTKRRPDEVEGTLIGKVLRRPEDERRKPPQREKPEEDDEPLEYSREELARVTAVARRDMVAETVSPAEAVATTALWTLIGSAGPTNVVPVAPATTQSKSASSLYDLLDQVIAQA